MLNSRNDDYVKSHPFFTTFIEKSLVPTTSDDSF